MSDYGTVIPLGGASIIATDDHPGYAPGRFYVPFGQGAAFAGAASATGIASFAFGVIKRRISISKLGARITTGSAGNFQLAVYGHDVASAAPSGLMRATGSISTATAALVDGSLTSAVVLEPGFYWFGQQVDNTGAIFMSQGASTLSFVSTIGSQSGAISSSVTQASGLSTPATFGSWPASLVGAAFTELPTRAPLVQFQVA